ncbi:MAG: hypothetical protein H8D35_03050 [Nitrosopumilus sp.]|nr:hypothetical protein [Nitrosopumilus sp.]
MGYAVKVQFAKDASIEVSGDDIVTVIRLLNESTRKFFPIHPGSKVEI